MGFRDGRSGAPVALTKISKPRRNKGKGKQVTADKKKTFALLKRFGAGDATLTIAELHKLHSLIRKKNRRKGIKDSNILGMIERKQLVMLLKRYVPSKPHLNKTELMRLRKLVKLHFDGEDQTELLQEIKISLAEISK